MEFEPLSQAGSQSSATSSLWLWGQGPLEGQSPAGAETSWGEQGTPSWGCCLEKWVEGWARAQQGPGASTPFVDKNSGAQRHQGLSRGSGPRPQTSSLPEQGLGRAGRCYGSVAAQVQHEHQPQVQGQGCLSAVPGYRRVPISSSPTPLPPPPRLHGLSLSNSEGRGGGTLGSGGNSSIGKCRY